MRHDVGGGTLIYLLCKSQTSEGITQSSKKWYLWLLLVTFDLGGHPDFLWVGWRCPWLCQCIGKWGLWGRFIQRGAIFFHEVVSSLKIFRYFMLKKNLAGCYLLCYLLFNLFLISSIISHHYRLWHFFRGEVDYWNKNSGYSCWWYIIHNSLIFLTFASIFSSVLS